MSPCGLKMSPAPSAGVCGVIASTRCWDRSPTLATAAGPGLTPAGISRLVTAYLNCFRDPRGQPTMAQAMVSTHRGRAKVPDRGARPSQKLHTCHRQAVMSGSCKVESSSLGGRSRGGQRLELRMSRKEREALATTANLLLVGRALPVPTTLSLAGSLARNPMKRAAVRVAAHACPRLLAGAPPRARTLDPTIKSPAVSLHNALQNKDLRVSAESPSAPFQRAGETAETAPQMPPDLAQLVAAWQHLPPAIRAGIVAMVFAAEPPEWRPRSAGHGQR